MSEAWHRQMDSVPWWDFDRIWNPQHYTCSTAYYPEWIIWLNRTLFVAAIITISVILSVLIVRWIYPKTIRMRYWKKQRELWKGTK